MLDWEIKKNLLEKAMGNHFCILFKEYYMDVSMKPSGVELAQKKCYLFVSVIHTSLFCVLTFRKVNTVTYSK